MRINVYLRLLHLLEGERSLVVAGDLNELHAPKTSNAERGDDAQVLQTHKFELFIDPEKRTHFTRSSSRPQIRTSKFQCLTMNNGST